MNSVIAVFGSRSETLTFSNALRRMGVANQIVSTPRQAGRTCGISVKFGYEYFQYGKIVLNQGRFVSFHGFFIEQQVGGREVITKG